MVRVGIIIGTIRLLLGPAPPNAPLLRASWSLLDGLCGVLKRSRAVLVMRDLSKRNIGFG